MDDARTRRIRRPPPPFRRLAVVGNDAITPRMRRVVLGGPELDGFELDLPAASVRLLLPPPGADRIVMPTWTGNQFELPDGSRAPIRTFTPRVFDPDRLELTLDIVVHETGAATDWVRTAAPGDVVAISGPGRGYVIDATASGYLLAGDETAIPAIDQLLESMPSNTTVHVHIEVDEPSGRFELVHHPGATVTWHDRPTGGAPGDTIVAAIEAFTDLPAGIWVAGEAAAVQRVRTHLFDERGLPRSAATVRGYWKLGRSAT